MSQGFLQLTSRCLNQPARGGIGGVVATSESQPDSCPLEPVVADAPANGACTTHYHEQQQHAPALAVSSEVITKSSTTGGLGSSKINIDDHPEPEPASSWDVSSNLKVAKIGKRKAGGWKTTPFIFVSEFCDKLAAGGLLINLISYLIQVMHFRTVEAATTVTNFSGASGLTPLLAAFVADAYLGRYATIIASTCVQLAGLLLLALTAVAHPLSPPPCPPFFTACRPATRAQTLLLYAALALTALGGGGIRACAGPFGAEQVVVAVSRRRRDNPDRGPAATAAHDDDNGLRLAAFFTGFYCAVCVALLCAATGVVYVQEAAGWAWGLGVPAVMVAVGGVVFVAGSPWYRRRSWGPCAGGSGGGSTPMVRLVAVVVAAVRKRGVRLPERAEELWHGDGDGGGRDEDGVVLDRPLKHTNQFRFLDCAAVVEPSRPGAADGAAATPNRWRLAPVAHIEELKCLLRMLPIWLCTIPVHAASAQQHTFSIQQARAMDRRILPSSSFRIPPGSYAAFALLPPLAFLPLHARLLHSRSSSTSSSRTSSTASAPLRRIGAGLLAAAAGLAVAGAVETHRRRLAHTHTHQHRPQPPSAYWLVPQYAVQGLAEAAMVTGQLEFAFSQSPDSLRSTATAVHWATVAAGSFLASAVTGGVHAATDWLASDDLDACRLAWFYWLLAGGTAASAVVYVACARWYCRHAPAAAEDDEEVGGAAGGDPVVQLACH